MNCMPRMVTYTKEIRTRYRIDGSGLLFLYVVEPNGFLTVSFDGKSLGKEMESSLMGLYEAHGEPIESIKLLEVENDEIVWAVTSQAFERTLQVA